MTDSLYISMFSERKVAGLRCGSGNIVGNHRCSPGGSVVSEPLSRQGQSRFVVFSAL